MHADIKYAHAVRGIEHLPAPVPSETTKTTALNVF